MVHALPDWGGTSKRPMVFVFDQPKVRTLQGRHSIETSWSPRSTTTLTLRLATSRRNAQQVILGVDVAIADSDYGIAALEGAC